MQLPKWLDTIQVLAIVCAQWGDSGKGKLVDFFAQWADYIVRGTGGANAGHTILINLKKFVFHLVPCGILYPYKINIIGNGVALDPEILDEELRILDREGVSYQNLFIALNAKLVFLPHKVLDMVRELRKGKIGSTGKGMAPTYEAHVGRKGFIVNDLLNPTTFKDKLESNLADMVVILKAFREELLEKGGTDVVREVMAKLGHEDFYDEDNIFDFEKIAKYYSSLGNRINGMVADTDTMIFEALDSGKKILLEGAQGTLLSVDYGTYPFVTSSDSTIRGLAKGAGLTTADVDRTILVLKAPYMTRVGDGPFPTEMGGIESAKWCRRMNEEAEARQYGHLTFATVADDFELGVCTRIKGGEFGATTGRLRRTGWLDLVSAQYAMEVNRTKSCCHVALTKLDVMAGYPEIKICIAYTYTGPDFQYGRQLIRTGDQITNFIPVAEVLKYCQPIYETFAGFGDISQIDSWEAAHENEALGKFLDFLRAYGFIIDLISNGSDRNQTLVRQR